MTIATITSMTVTASTGASFMNSVETACINAGMGTVFDSFVTGGQTHRIFKLDSPNVGGKSVYFDIFIDTGNSRRVFSFLYATWNAVNRTGTGQSIIYNDIVGYPGPTSIELDGITPIIMYSVNHPELKIIWVNQASPGKVSRIMGIFKPLNIPFWWIEATWAMTFMAGNLEGFFLWNPVGAGENPLGATTSCLILSNTSMSAINPYTSKRDIYKGLVVTSNTVTGNRIGLIARSSDDLCLVCATGMAFLDVLRVTPGVEEYTLLSNGGSPGFAIRTV